MIEVFMRPQVDAQGFYLCSELMLESVVCLWLLSMSRLC